MPTPQDPHISPVPDTRPAPVQRAAARTWWAGALLCALLALTGCAGASGDNASDGPNAGERVTIVAFSAPREVLEELMPMFNATPEGAGVRFGQSYGSSGEQSRSVIGGLPADVVLLSLEPDMANLVDAGKVSEDWNRDAYGGMVSSSVVVLAVRAGNPKSITGWDDLLRDDVEVVTPNPFTSGGARWNLMAALGAWKRSGDSERVALDKLEQLLRNTPVQSASARESLQIFAAGKGDVMIAYENEVLLARRNGQRIDFVVPSSTILIENPWAVTADSESPEAARDFHRFALTPPAQRAFARHGFRPVVTGVRTVVKFEQPEDLFTIEDVGGWPAVMKRYFDREDGEVARINRGLGAVGDG